MAGAVVAVTVDPVEDGLNLVVVVLLGLEVVGRPVLLARIGGCGRVRAAVDLGGEEVVDATTRRTRHDLVGGVLVGPGGDQPVLVGHFEDGVHLQVLVRIDGLAGGRVDRKLGWIDDVLGVADHVEDVGPRVGPGGGYEALAGIEGAQVLVERFEVGDLGPRRRSGTGGGARGEHGVVPGVVVVDAGARRIASRHLADQSGERVRRERGAGIREVDAPADQGGQRRTGVVLYVPPQVGLVEPVDR